MKWLIMVASSVALVLDSGTGWAHAPSVTIDQLRQILITQRGLIRSMQGSFTFETTPDREAEASQEMRGIVRKLKVRFAWSGAKRLVFQEGEIVTDNMKVISTNSKNVYDGKDFRRRELKQFLIQREKSTYSEQNLYLHTLQWPTTNAELAQCRHAPDQTRFLPYCLEADGWQVRSRHELLDGISCVVVERPAAGLRFWLDPRRGYCLLRCECDRPLKGHRRYVFTYKGFRSVLPGVYFPMEIVASKELEDKDGMPTGTRTTRIVVHQLRVNDVSDSLFVLEPNVGDYVIDKPRQQTYVYTYAANNTLDVASQQASRAIGSTWHTRLVSKISAFLVALAIGALLVYWVARAARHVQRD